MLIKACLNGSREPGAHPALPLTPEQLAHAAQQSIAAGAGALHIHPRDTDGNESLATQDQAATLTAIRATCPGTPVGVSTGLWIVPDVESRFQHIQTWTILPDYASVNFSEPGTAKLCNLLLTMGIGIEAGLSNLDDAQLLVKLGLADRCLRILIEPDGETTEAGLTNTRAIIDCLDHATVQIPRLLHGFQTTTWPILEAALHYGYDTRIGLEDTLTLPNGNQAQDNAELVAVAVRMARETGKL